MGMDKYGCFMQYMFIIIETIVNIEHEELICFIGHICFSKHMFMSIRHIKKRKEQICSYYFFLCIEQFTDTNLFTFSHYRTVLLLNMQHIHLLFIITFVCFSVPHIVAYCDAAKFSIKLFSFIYFTVSVVRQWDKYEIMTETRSIV